MAAPPLAFLDDAPSGSRAALAIFGKHPSAADHMEDFGLSTRSLVTFKQGFYVDGIGGALSKQVWARDLVATPESIPYDHLLLSVSKLGWLAARFKHSSDAAGRKQFPLVVAVHGADLTALHAAADIGIFLEQQLSEAVAAGDATRLREVLRAGQDQLDRDALRWSKRRDLDGKERADFLTQSRLSSDPEAIMRACHAFSPQGAGAVRARLPIRTSEQWPDLVLWASFVQTLLQGKASWLTVLAATGQAFADLHVGPPGSRIVAGLFATEATVPLCTNVPFNVSDELRSASSALIQEWSISSELFSHPAASDETRSMLEKVCNCLGRLFK